MTDTLLLRFSIVVGVALLLVVVWLVMKRPRPLQTLEGTGLEPGVHLFTATRCRGCEELRRELDSIIGRDAYREHAEETDPSLFISAAIELVPVVVTVDDSRTARVWGAVPSRRVLERGRHR